MRIHVRNNLAAPHSGKDSPVYALISGKLRLSDGLSLSSIDPATLWTSGWWGLSNDSTYRKLRPELQKQVLRACNSTLLNEAYFVEKSGLAYSAKMVLSASSTDIAQLYTLIGADEAKHLAWVEPYIEPDQKTRPAGQFLAFLSKLIEDVSPRLLVYLVQIILEGWGLDHYRRLANGCSRPHFSALLLNILRDEALHH